MPWLPGFNRLVGVCSLLILLVSCSADSLATKVPGGLYVLTPPGKPVLSSALTSDLVAGIVLRGNWQDIDQPGDELSIEYYRNQLDRIQAAGKVASLVINSGGMNTPAHVMNRVERTVEFVDGNRFHRSYGESIVIPSFYDPKFVELKLEFIARLGSALAGHPALRLVSVQCANATTDDWNIPGSIDWLTTSFDEGALLATCQKFIDATAQYFPTQAMRMAVGSMPRNLRKYRDLPQKVADYGLAKYPSRFYVQRHNLSVTTPVPGQPRGLMGWKTVAAAAPYNAAQFLWPASDTRSCRLNGGRKPCDSQALLSEVATIIAQHKFHYVEVYGADFERLAGSSGFMALYKAFGDQNTLVKNTVGDQPSQSRRSPNLRAGGSPIYGHWSNPPSTNSRANALVEHYEMTSELLGDTVGYSIYLPKTAIDENSRLPVLYWLHGKQGDETRGAYLAQFMDRAIADGKIRPAAMVLVNGGRQSFYSDAKDGSAPVESMLMEELIPHIESTFSIGGQRRLRMLEGFSMGGFGALKLAGKYPDQFASVAVYGAALLSEKFMPKRNDQAAYEAVFGADASYFIGNTPSYWFEKNAAKIRALGLPIRIRVGTKDGTRRYNQDFVSLLERLSIPADFAMLEDVGHAPRQYYQADDLASFTFHESILTESE